MPLSARRKPRRRCCEGRSILCAISAAELSAVIVSEGGQSSTPQSSGGYCMPASAGMTPLHQSWRGTAVDGNRRALDVARLGTRQKQRQLGDIFRLANPARAALFQRFFAYLLRRLVLRLGELLE